MCLEVGNKDKKVKKYEETIFFINFGWLVGS